MKNYKIIIVLILGLLIQSVNAQDKKLAQTGMKFLSVSTDARTTGFSEAVTSVELGSASAIFYNPSTMAYQTDFSSITFGYVGWIADIDYLHAAASFAPFGGDYGVFGVSFVSVDYGKFNGTIVANNEQGYLDVGTYSPTAYAFGIAYARELSTKFSVGGSVRFIKQDLGKSVVDLFNASSTTYGYKYEENTKSSVAYDFGILYRTGFKSLNFGMSVRNFSAELKYKRETFQLPLTFKIGLSMDAMDFLNVDKKLHSLLVSVDASHPRDYAKQIAVGAEYTFLNTFCLRAGFISPSDENHFTAGFGIKGNDKGLNVGFDYAYQPFGIFEDVHRFTFNFSF